MSDYADIRDDVFVHIPALDAAINAGDRCYRNTITNRLIKVRVTRQQPPPGAPGFGQFYFAVSGAHCGEDGRALKRIDDADAFQIAPAHMLTLASDAPNDLALALERARLKVCCDTERAVEHELRFAALA